MALISLVLILVLSAFSFQGLLYFRLNPYMGIGWSYVIDQSFPLVITLLTLGAFAIRSLKKKSNHKNFLKALKEHRVNIFLILTILFLAHGFLLKYYFFAEDISSVLSKVNNGIIDFPFDPINNGYALLPFIFSFLIFKTNALFYNVISIISFIFAALSLYVLSYTLSKDKLVALFSSLFFVTTPVFLDMFSWQGSVSGMSFVLGLSLLSLIFLIFFQINSRIIYYILSILFFISAVKTGFVRTAGLAIPIGFLILFPFPWAKARSFSKRFLFVIPYLIIWLEFLLFRWQFTGFISTGNVFKVSDYLSTLFYYFAMVFFPSKFAAIIFPWLKGNAFSISNFLSLVFIIGLVLLIVLIPLFLFSFLKRKTNFFWLIFYAIVIIFGGLFYVPLFGTVPSPVNFDNYFIASVPPYGPGSRYVFFSSVGVSLLLGALFSLSISSKKIFVKPIGLLLIAILFLNLWATIGGHQKIVSSISEPDKKFMKNFFTLVPIDGKKKLVFSTNPTRNMIDNNVGASRWLYGFYKETELTYVNDEKKFLELANSGIYKKENTYAFYNNPETGSFANVSLEARDALEGKNDEIPLNFSSEEASTKFEKVISTDGYKLNLLQRAVLETSDINKRIFIGTSLKLNISSSESPSEFPYSDSLVFDSHSDIPKGLLYLIPQYSPSVTSSLKNFSFSTLDSFNNVSAKDIPDSDRNSIINTLISREKLRAGTVLSVSNIDNSNPNSSAFSLLDGLYTSEPKPAPDEKFYISSSSSSAINFILPYPTILGRVLLNTSKSYASEHFPQNIEVLGSVDGVNFELIGTYKGEVYPWSSNNGKMVEINLVPMESRFVKVILDNEAGESIMLDEIILDDIDSLSHTPWQIGEYQSKSFKFVDNEMLLSSLRSLDSARFATIFYSCAENIDWKRQTKNADALVPGVWNRIILSTEDISDITIPINCYGSLLRKIIIIGPPYPSSFGGNASIGSD